MLDNLLLRASLGWIGVTTKLTNRLWKNRTIALPHLMTEEACNDVIRGLGLLEKESGEPILLMCDSGGGALYPSIRLARKIVECRAPVVTLVYYYANSAAVNVFAAGHLRLMRPQANLGTHAAAFWNRERIVSALAPLEDPDSIDVAIDVLQRASTGECKKHLEAVAGRALPDEMFGEQMSYHGLQASKELGLADGTFFRPPVEALFVARRMMADRMKLATT